MKPNHFDILTNDLQVKEAENYLLQSELTDTLRPSVISFESIGIVVQMLSELNVYIRKNGNNETSEKSKARLTKLFNSIHDLSNLTEVNYSLQNTNRILNGQNNLLRVKVKELEDKLSIVNKAFEGI